MDRFLAGLPVFADLPAAERDALFPRMLLRRYRKGEPVFEEGAAADAVHLLRSGLVKAVKYSPRAEPASMEVIVPGQLFGMIAVMDKRPYPVSAVPISPCEAYAIPARLFTGILGRNPGFSKRVFASVGDHLRQAQSLRALASESVESRVAHVLLALSAAMGPSLAVRREDVAELAGCTPPTAIRTLAAFRRKGLVASGWKRITVLRPDALARLAEPR